MRFRYKKKGQMWYIWKPRVTRRKNRLYWKPIHMRPSRYIREMEKTDG